MKYKRIYDIEQYNEYCNIYEELANKDYEKYVEELDLLGLLIEDYDNKMIKKFGIAEDMNPVELLDYLLDEQDLTKAEFARQLGVSRQLISDILKYKRNISKNMVMKLSDYFGMRPLAFSRPYLLSGNSKSAA